MTTTKIEWTDRTWNPVIGCTKVSPGCDHCYAEGIARRFAGGKAFPNGFDVTLHEDRIAAPLRWRKPARVFVNSMSDLFHQDIPDHFIAQVFAVMAATPMHTYQVLTKRHGRMRSLLSRPDFIDLVIEHLHTSLDLNPDYVDGVVEQWGWPLRNVWLGVSVEDQQRADLRIPVLLATPAAVRFLSCEPLLGPVDLGRWTHDLDEVEQVRVCQEHGWPGCDQSPECRVIDWVIVGGESGPGARPMHSAWVRELREQCTAADVPFFMKQWGEWAPIDQPGRSAFDYVTDDDRCQIVDIRGNLRGRPWAGWKVQDGTRDAEPVRRYGKKVAGRELDGHTWDQYPGVPA